MKPRPTILASAFIILVSCSTTLEKGVPSRDPANIYIHEGVKIHFKDVGAGRALVFIHGFGASLDSWRFIEDALKNEYRLILVDLKGHGYSDRPRDDRYSPQDHAEVVTGLIEHLRLSNVVLVGHSFGSAVTLLVALKAQKSSSGIVSGLVLFAGSIDPYNLPFFLRLLRIPVIGWLGMKLTTASFRTQMAFRRAYYDDSKVTDSLVEIYAKYQNIPGTDYAMLRTAQQFVPPDLSQQREEVKNLQFPVINIYGQHDEVVARESSGALCRLLPRCTLVTVEGVGHIPMEERPEKIVPLLRDFVSKAFSH